MSNEYNIAQSGNSKITITGRFARIETTLHGISKLYWNEPEESGRGPVPPPSPPKGANSCGSSLLSAVLGACPDYLARSRCFLREAHATLTLEKTFTVSNWRVTSLSGSASMGLESKEVRTWFFLKVRFTMHPRQTDAHSAVEKAEKLARFAFAITLPLR